jgi:hypothetical protein
MALASHKWRDAMSLEKHPQPGAYGPTAALVDHASGRAVPRHLALIAVVGLAGATGCSVTHTEPGLTTARFIARADAICQAEDQKLTYIEHRAGALEGASIASFRSVAPLIRKAVAVQEAANAKLESLPEPPRDTAAIQKWLTARTVAATVASDSAEAPAGQDLAAARDVQKELSRAIAHARDLARGYGFKVCGATE